MNYISLRTKKVFFFLTIYIFSLPNLFASNTKFYNINDIHGISIRETYSICKDSNGFIWASSKTGILRLSEDDYRTYHLPYETANIINIKLEYTNGNLFAYSNNGQIFRLNQLYDKFELLINASKYLNNQFLSLNKALIDEKGAFWMATSKGLYKYTDNDLQRMGSDTSDVYFLEWYDKTSFFLLKINGLWLYNIATGENECLYNNTTISNFIASSLFYDHIQNRLWIGTISNGLFYYDYLTKDFKQTSNKKLPKQPFLAIEENSDSTLMLGIDGQGIWEINKTDEKVLNVYTEISEDPSSIRGNGIYDIFNDKNHHIWVCTYSGGVSFFDQTTPSINQIVHQLNNPNSLINNDINSVIEDKQGNLWFATNNGISCWDVASNKWATLYHNKKEQSQVFLSLCEDNTGKIWAGTYSSGVYVIDEKNKKELAHYSREEQSAIYDNNFVFDIYKDSAGDIWIVGIQGKIICYKLKDNTFRSYSQQPVSVIIELQPDKMLIGCSYGLSVLDKNTGELTSLINGFIIQDLIKIDNILWVCTSGDGLIRFDLKTRSYKQFNLCSGLPSNFINSITLSIGYLWLGTENGLCRFNPSDFSVTTYSSIYPLSNISFNRNAQFNLKNGQVVWGTNNGALLFAPTTIQQMQFQGKIFLQDLIISGRSIKDSSNIMLKSPLDSIQGLTLNHNQNTLTIELLPIGVSAPGSKFSWKLEGYDKEWILPAQNRILTYTNIPSGDFTLKIKLYNSSQSQMIDERKIFIHVIPPYWQSWWFKSLSFVFATIIILAFLLFYKDRLDKLHSHEKIRFFANTAHDIRTILTLINAPIEELNKEPNLSESGTYYLKLAGKQTKQMSEIATQLLDFQKVDVNKDQLNLTMVDLAKFVDYQKIMFEPLAATKNIDIRLESNLSGLKTAIDEMMIEKVINNLLSNAIKYSNPKSLVEIILKSNKTNWVLEVKDTGIGISKKVQHKLFREFYRGDNAINAKIAGSGIGLLLIKNYITLHGGKISCESLENSGSTFRVTIPIKTTTGINKEIELPKTTTTFDIQDIGVTNTSFETRDMHILIVEDNDELRNFMKISLQNEFQVLTAIDGTIAWDIIRDQIPDLVVSDIMMPNMNGFELCQTLKSTYETSHIPIILLTALSENTDQMHGLGLGADDYLVKPFNISLLSQKIKSIIRNREIIRGKALKLIKRNSEEPILANELNDKFIKDAMKVVRTHIADVNFGKEKFAFEMNVSSSLLYKKIKSLTDQSPVDFIKTVRLDHAVGILESRKHTITETSELCGFSSVGYFCTVFKKQFGKSPTEILGS
jgi:signal transduction histidine kinase/CheY-like chemotaxis protein/ligand-binding sensor domain-containing protein